MGHIQYACAQQWSAYYTLTCATKIPAELLRQRGVLHARRMLGQQGTSHRHLLIEVAELGQALVGNLDDCALSVAGLGEAVDDNRGRHLLVLQVKARCILYRLY